MFNDKYGLTAAVLGRKKTCTRRLMSYGDAYRYQIGEVIAVAQNYKELLDKGFLVDDEHLTLSNSPGYKNKMFVKSELMQKHIRITGVRMERLQEISDEDCMKEGVLSSDKYAMPYGIPTCDGVFFYYSTPREAFADLIDKVSGRGTWDSNPTVAVYDFELVEK